MKSRAGSLQDYCLDSKQNSEDHCSGTFYFHRMAESGRDFSWPNPHPSKDTPEHCAEDHVQAVSEIM